MVEFGDPYTKRSLIKAVQKSQNDVTAFFSNLSLEAFYQTQTDAWSPAENLQHLIKSVKPVSLSMKLPKFVLAALFGRSTRVSRRFANITAMYRDELQKGATASWFFRPAQRITKEDDAETRRHQLLQKWEKAGSDLLTQLLKWSEQDLDRYRLPHPILGKLSVREMLLFTIYHDTHHIMGVKRRLKKEKISTH